MMPSPCVTNQAAPLRSKRIVPPDETALVSDRFLGWVSVPTCVNKESARVHDQKRPSGPAAKVGNCPKHFPDRALWNQCCPRERKYVPSTAPQVHMVADSSAATVDGPSTGKFQSVLIHRHRWPSNRARPVSTAAQTVPSRSMAKDLTVPMGRPLSSA